jgi:hypothetical protein
MKQLIAQSFFLLAFSMATGAQTTATDFTSSNCLGTEYHLFSQLDAGKVVVISWVMPCGACIGPTLAAFTAAESFSESHPGMVQFLMIDDFGDTNCNTLMSWANQNGMPKESAFSNSAISMDNYGAYGMPKVVVLGGGSNHKIFYNANNNDPTYEGVRNAILQALTTSVVSEIPMADFGLSVSPNPAHEDVNISFSLPEASSVRLQVYNALGMAVQPGVPFEEERPAGRHSVRLDTGNLPAGVYFLRLDTETGFQLASFQISR